MIYQYENHYQFDTKCIYCNKRYEGGRIQKKGADESTCAVAISKAQKTDNGRWQCHVSTMDTYKNNVITKTDIDIHVVGRM